MDEMVPVHKRGRAALVSDPGVRWECAKCPKYEPPRLWCPLRAETRQPIAPACRYGIVLIGAAKQKEH